VVRVDPRYFRPTEVDKLVGGATKARQKLGWKPRSGFQDLVREKVAKDLKLLDCCQPSLIDVSWQPPSVLEKQKFKVTCIAPR